MKSRTAGLLALMLAALACGGGNAVAQAETGRRVALVIGNSAYAKLAPLANPGNDARRMSAILAANGYDVMSCDGVAAGCFDLDRGALLDAVEDFATKAKGADAAFVYYAGHGLQTGAGNVLAPTDFEMDCASGDARRSVLLDELIEAAQGARHKIVVIDACRNDPFRAQQCPNRGVRLYAFGALAVPQTASRMLLFSSTQNGQVAQDGLPGEHSPFAQSLFDWMEKSPRVNFDQLFNRVAISVMDATAAQNFTQVPEMLVRGGAPDACLAGKDCTADPDAGPLREQVEAKGNEKSRDQQFEFIVTSLMQSSGIDPKTVSVEEKEQFYRTVIAAAKSLETKGAEGETALAALSGGDSKPAEQIFARDVAQSQNDPNFPPETIAASARDMAALARVQGRLDEALDLYIQAYRTQNADLRSAIDLAETAMAAGEVDVARDAYVDAVYGYLRGSPADRVWALEGLADTYWNSDQNQALDLYRKANALATSLASEHPDDTGVKRGLIVTHYNIGHIALDRGQTANAIDDFQKGLAIANTLAAENPADLRWQYDVGRGHERLGRAMLASGDVDAALDQFLQKQAIALKLARSGEATYVQDAALAEEFLADVAVRKGDLASAELRYEASLGQMIPLRDSAPGNPSFQRFTAVTMLSLGDVQVEQGKADAAWENYSKAAAISEKLAADHPRNGQWRWDLFRAYQRLASTRPPGAEYHAKALAVIEAMKADGVLDPANEKWIEVTRERLQEAQKK